MSDVPARPLPEITPRMRPFWDGVAQRRFLIQQCRDCGTNRFPAVEICNGCLGDSLEWIEASGRASLFSFVVMHQVYHPAFSARAPYLVADVRLEEGPRIISNVIGCEREDVKIGMALVVDFEQVAPPASQRADETVTALPVFRPVG